MKARMFAIVFVALVFIVVIPLAGRPSGEHLAPDGIDGIWYLRVDRVWNRSGNAGFPSLLLAESTYSRVSDGPTYRIVISGRPEQGYQISIDDPPIRGRQQPTYALQYVFELEDGSGGRFLIMHGKDGLEGELTIYGSGVPIIKSERGAFTR
jgi:hypothetical protein